LNYIQTTMRRALAVFHLCVTLSLPVAQAADAEVSMLHLAQRKQSEGDPTITLIGAFATRGTTAAHFDLAQYRDAVKGEAWAMEFGAGYLIPTQVNVFAGGGIVAGYRRQDGDFFGAYYPEAGAVIALTPALGVSASKKRYFKLFQEVEDVVMFGVVFTSR
jgi:hypothetical protein